jgi:hypothetical protein
MPAIAPLLRPLEEVLEDETGVAVSVAEADEVVDEEVVDDEEEEDELDWWDMVSGPTVRLCVDNSTETV